MIKEVKGVLPAIEPSRLYTKDDLGQYLGVSGARAAGILAGNPDIISAHCVCVGGGEKRKRYNITGAGIMLLRAYRDRAGLWTPDVVSSPLYIQIPSPEVRSAATGKMRGKIKVLRSKGYGFIITADGAQEVFFHCSNMQEPSSFADLRVGDEVEFDARQTLRGIAGFEVQKK